MRIGEITRLTGVSKDTVRFYERQGLLRTVNGVGTLEEIAAGIRKSIGR